MDRFQVICAAALFWMTAAAAADPLSEAAPATRLLDALQRYSEWTGRPVYADPAAVSGLRSAEVPAGLDADRALAALLTGLPVEARMEHGAVLITRRPAGPAEAAATPPRPALARVEVIEVRGFRQAYSRALSVKRGADQIVDAILAEEAGRFPDQNLAEALQRIAGVQITRNNGEGEFVTIRGLDPAFTRIEIDGRTTTVTADSAEPERESLLNVFATELYDRIEVVKSSTAADVEGGSGGTVRLTTPRPLDHGGRRWGVDVSLTRGERRDDVEPALSGFFSDVTAGGRVGFILSGSYEDLDRRIDKIENNPGYAPVEAARLADPNDPALQALTGASYAIRHRQEQRAGDRRRLNLAGRVEAEPAPDWRLSLGGLYTLDDREEDRSRLQINWREGLLTAGTADPAAGLLTAAAFEDQRTEFLQFSRFTDVETAGADLSAAWTPARWSLRAMLNASRSKETFEEYRVDHRSDDDASGGYRLAGDPLRPVLSAAALEVPLAELAVRRLEFSRREITLSERAVRFDAERALDAPGVTSIAAGVRESVSEYDRLQGAVRSAAELSYADGASGFVLDGTFGEGAALARWPSIDPVPLYRANPSETDFRFDDENVFTIEERVSAAYVQLNYDAMLGVVRARGNAGVRVVETRYEGQGRIDIDVGETEFLIDGAPPVSRDYVEALPAFNLMVSRPGAASDWRLRAAVSKSMTRPRIGELNPAEDVRVDDARIIRGEPGLNPFLAWRFDLGAEYYFNDGEGLLAAGLFAKDVENFVARSTSEETRAFLSADFPELTADIPAQTYRVESFRNGGEATIRGVELNLQTPFSVLPAPWSDFGVLANYTYTDSEFIDAFGNRFSFPGASAHAYNLAVYYERSGFSARLAYTYRGDFLIEPAPEADGRNARYGAGGGRLDAALRYRFDSGWRLRLDALNLTGAQVHRYYDSPDRLEDLQFEGPILSLGAGYRF